MSRLQRIHTWGSTGLLILLMALSGLTAFGCASGVGDGVQNPDQIVGVGVQAASLGDAAFGAPAAWVSWSAPQGFPVVPQPRGGYVVGYELYRAASPRAAAVPANMIAFLEGGGVTSFIDSADEPRQSQQVTVTTNETSGYVAVNRAAATGPASTTYGTDSITYVIVPSPPSPGDLYTYTVRAVVKKLPPQPFPGTGGSLDLGGELVLSTEARSTQATVLEPPILTDPPNSPDPGSYDVDIATTLFSWQASASADTYVIEFSTDRAFPPSNTSRTRPYLLSAAAGAIISQTVNEPAIADGFATVTSPIYWRVGARNSGDALYPRDRFGRPVDWVYSDSRSFTGIERPPSAP